MQRATPVTAAAFPAAPSLASRDGDAAGTAAALEPSVAAGRGPAKSQPNTQTTLGGSSAIQIRHRQRGPGPSTPARITARARSTFLEHSLPNVWAVCGLADDLADGMLRGMRRFGVATLCVLVAFGCGGQAGADSSSRAAGTPALPPVPDAGPMLAPAAKPAPLTPDQPPPEPQPFEDPGCPPVAASPVDKQCDPLAAGSGCPAGTSCFPFVRYPSGPCEVEQYGTTCLPSGPGTQGASCERTACAAEHICISTGRGTQCARICSFAEGAQNVCAPGLLCLPIDIEGFGGCL
jgi:hypothetical protein